MKIEEINGDKFKDMIRVASHRIKKNSDFVNSLNVFPVPDGDTGTNMSLTFASGAKAVNENPSNSVGELGKSLAKGLLMGARGNSGVITSQIFRGFTKKIEPQTSISARQLADAFMAGVETAYKAVMKPVEGTILTVAREGAKAGNKTANETNDITEVLKAVILASKKALANTPNLLPVLKEVGVVDSGGQGLVFIYEGFLEGLTGEVAAKDIYTPDEAEMDEMVNAVHHRAIQGQVATANITYGYCTEMMVNIAEKKADQKTFDYDTFRNYLNNLGDSLLVVADDEVVKVHVHTEHPEKVYRYGSQFGTMHKIKIDNMRVQNENVVNEAQAASNKQSKRPQVDYAVIAIASGDGLQQLFESLGVTFVINGGQTMNPSTQDILDAIEQVNAKRVIIMPNNKNIFLSAEQAADVSDISVAVVPTKTISQGMTAMLSFDPAADLNTNKKQMTDALTTVVSGQLTAATRDTELSGLKIKQGDYLGIVDGTIKVANPDRLQAAIQMVETMLDDETEIITIIYGADATSQEAKSLEAAILAKHDDLEIEIHEGDQPVYPFLISAE
ncbi:DAK2 domain-containing protein [Lactobacillus sp. CC-MHH1034]|uniref:DAK2 domain-containing protein n=1 Tax=Agrilactobacillus fermenti TaxID=2586909 RepID=UPI001E5DF84B|nr:DAK2 domain-containing protein [Agrilactobacillus fermenti]MCD2256229.1 DAK2 domain-containing protein [Agrilactobacillus fermenti]